MNCTCDELVAGPVAPCPKHSEPRPLSLFGGSEVTIVLKSVMRPRDVAPLLKAATTSGGLGVSQNGRFVDGLGVVEWSTKLSIAQLVNTALEELQDEMAKYAHGTPPAFSLDRTKARLLELQDRLGVK